MSRIISAFCLTFCFLSMSIAQTPPEVLEPYKAYVAALKKKDQNETLIQALKTWEASEKVLGDHKTTGDTAFNYANINPTGDKKTLIRITRNE